MAISNAESPVGSKFGPHIFFVRASGRERDPLDSGKVRVGRGGGCIVYMYIIDQAGFNGLGDIWRATVVCRKTSPLLQSIFDLLICQSQS